MRQGQRLTGMSATQSAFPIVPSAFAFARHGKSGAWVSELLPHTARIADQLTFVKSVHTEAINHDPAVTFLQTGSQIAGRPSMGSWLAYGLGAETQDLPAFVVMISPGKGGGGQPLYDRLWGSGFLPTRYQGVKFRSVGDPVLYLSNPHGFDSEDRRVYLNALGELNRMKLEQFGDPEISTRISQYEMAFRMQSSVPELTDLSKEPRGSSIFTERTPARRAPSPPTACLRAGWPNAAFASFSCITAIGTTTESCRPSCPNGARIPTRPPPRSYRT